jgi:hypothetical protein
MTSASLRSGLAETGKFSAATVLLVAGLLKLNLAFTFSQFAGPSSWTLNAIHAV